MNGFLFPKEDTKVLTKIVFRLVSNGKLSPLARNAALIAKRTIKNLMVSETVEGYASLLENILMLPSEVATPRVAREIQMEFKTKWLWHHFENFRDANSSNNSGIVLKSLDEAEKQLNRTHKDKDNSHVLITTNDTIIYAIWEEQKYFDMAYMRKRREDEEVSDFDYPSP